MHPELSVRSYRSTYSVNYTCSPDIIIENYKNSLFVIDRNVFSLYPHLFKYVKNLLLVDAIESNKTLEHACLIINKFFSDFSHALYLPVVVIGGGIVQDIMTFVTAVIKRGIDWIYLPTTLLSMGDSCIGSKSSLNLIGQKKPDWPFLSPLQNIYMSSFFVNS